MKQGKNVVCTAHSALVNEARKMYKPCGIDTNINSDCNNFADADMQYNDTWQWDLTQRQDKALGSSKNAVGVQCPVPQNGDATLLVTHDPPIRRGLHQHLPQL